ncbi:peptidyl-tRNA hydrolase II domain-containing protein [Pavlovales sp. CCMP2436]|nr:peptidyl-tRNA hydrolase II domain-containing protein [Pavlovales sp. CCMP2436]
MAATATTRRAFCSCALFAVCSSSRLQITAAAARAVPPVPSSGRGSRSRLTSTAPRRALSMSDTHALSMSDTRALSISDTRALSMSDTRTLSMSNTRALSMSKLSMSDAMSDADPLFQYVVLRRDLQEKIGWPLGSLVAQGCHASVAAIVTHLEDEEVRAYIAVDALGGMHKAVLEVKGEAQLITLAQRLADAGIAHHLWIEQPEAIPTALACKPARKSILAPHFKKCQLSTWRAPSPVSGAAAQGGQSGAPAADEFGWGH